MFLEKCFYLRITATTLFIFQLSRNAILSLNKRDYLVKGINGFPSELENQIQNFSSLEWFDFIGGTIWL